MELKRRKFLAVCGAALAAAAGGWAWLRTKPPVRWLVAARGGRYPGPVRPLDANEIKKPGRWRG
jgi:hypothetical protein